MAYRVATVELPMKHPILAVFLGVLACGLLAQDVRMAALDHPPFTVKAPAASVVFNTVSQEANALKFNPSNPARPGLSVEVMRALERLDPEIHFTGLQHLYPTKRIESELEHNHIDVFFGLIKSPARKSKMAFLDSPVLYLQLDQIAVNMDDSVEVGSFNDIRKLKADGIIGVPQGSAFIDFLNKQGGLTIDSGTVSVVNTLRKLLARRIRFVYFGGAVIRQYIEAEHLESKIRILPAVFNSEPLYIVTSRQLDPVRLTRLTAALNALVKSGELAKIQQKYRVK